jgi:hypothetical protein
MENAKLELRPEVAKEFEVAFAKEAGEVNHPKYGLVNLSTVSLEKAKQLAAANDFKYLVAKAKPAAGK